MKKTISFFLLMVTLVWACSETTEEIIIEPDGVDNPFDDIDYGGGVQVGLMPDSSSFLGLHQYIFSSSCNQPGCHDGTFEPDFRTVQSAYNSLVSHPITKNYVLAVDEKEPLPARVVPGNIDASMMWQRLTIHDPPNFEIMPSSGIPLSDEKIEAIKKWIEDGALDVYGNPPDPSSAQPFSFGVLSYIGPFRIDTIRPGSAFNPFQTLADQEMTLWVGFVDYDVNGNFAFGNELTNTKIQLSTSISDFSNAIELDLEEVSTPLSVNSVFSQPDNGPLPYYHRVNIRPSDYGFSPGDFVFIRTYSQDSDHDEITENPQIDTPFALQLYFSFQVN